MVPLNWILVFCPDPFSIEVTSGGPVSAYERMGCAGMISDPPDFRLYYTAGTTFPLILSVDSTGDTTLVVSTPDGGWTCDDDSGEGLNPAITFEYPMTGQYDIWVGSFGGNYDPATLYISELDVQSSSSSLRPDYMLEPGYGYVDLSAGFSPDPYDVSLTSGGSVNSDVVGCTGMIAEAPDFRLNYSAGDVFPLILSVDSSGDTTLVVNTPDASWVCDDDSGEGLNPSITFDQPASGQYDIWVGSYSDDYHEALLSISELYSK